MKRFLQGLSATTSPYVGKTYRVGRYECLVEEQIAEGGFSLVFLVRANNGTHYALKRISVNNRKDLAIGQQEIMIMKKLSSHKNIITYIDSSVSEVSPGIYELLILMEYCRDGHVIQLMNDNLNSGLNEELILRIFTDVCEAVATLHQSQPPVQHRDLKVENILRNAKGDFVLCDYGSASTTPINLQECKLTEVEEEIQRFTTLSYRAPEMVDLYSGKIIDTKADVWALGCLLYKLCFLIVPFGESVLAIQNGQFSIPDSSRYSKELHSLIRYILEPDPSSRPDIYQVSVVAFQLRRMSCPVKNTKNAAVPKQLPEAGSMLTAPEKSKVSRQVHEPVSTSLKPRNRPRAGGANMTSSANVPVGQNVPIGQSTVDAQAPNAQSTLLHQAQAYQQQQSDLVSQQQNFRAPSPVVHQSRRPDTHTNTHAHARPPGQPAYLNPFGQRPSREPSPMGRRLDVPNREFTHVRSSSDPVPFIRDNNQFFSVANQNEIGGPRNVVPVNQGQHLGGNTVPTAYMRETDSMPTFPKWNPFSNDFTLNTQTTDEDFANLRRPAPSVPQGSQQTTVQHVQRSSNQTFVPHFSSGHPQSRFAQAPLNNSLNLPGTPGSNNSPYSSKSSSRRSSDTDEDAILARPIVQSHLDDISAKRGFGGLEASVNAGCDVDEMTTRFDRNTRLHDAQRTPGQRSVPTDVFDAVPFRKPAQRTAAQATPVIPDDEGRDPFGSVPFKQREAAKLARKQARRNMRNDRGQTGTEQNKGKRILPTVPTQMRM